ncbi:unnamed protein product [Rotaria magnacalcarata]
MDIDQSIFYVVQELVNNLSHDTDVDRSTTTTVEQDLNANIQENEAAQNASEKHPIVLDNQKNDQIEEHHTQLESTEQHRTQIDQSEQHRTQLESTEQHHIQIDQSEQHRTQADRSDEYHTQLESTEQHRTQADRSGEYHTQLDQSEQFIVQNFNAGINNELIVLKIVQINTDIDFRWKIIATVICKQPTRTYTNANGLGEISTWDLADDTGSINLVAFNFNSKSMSDKLIEGKSFEFTGLSIKTADSVYKTLSHPFQLIATNRTNVQETLMLFKYELTHNFTNLNEIEYLPINSTVDVQVGVLRDYGITTGSTNDNTWTRRELHVHQDGAHIRMTLWNEQINQHSTDYNGVVINNVDNLVPAVAGNGFDPQCLDDDDNDDGNMMINAQNRSIRNSTHSVSDYQNDLNHENKERLSNTEERLKINILRLLINLKSNNVTETCIDICSKDVINILNEYKDVNTEIYFNNIRKTIETSICRDKFISSHINVIRPKSITSLVKHLYVFSKKKQRQIRYIHKAQYIPFKESLINLLKKPEVLESLNCRSRSNVMTDLSTGSFCEQYPVFGVPDSLKIILFYDDIGINNPLGSRVKSVGMFYWTLANLPRFVRSQDRRVFLLACIEKKYLKQYGFTPVLDDFFHAIGELETNGLSLVIDEKTHVFRGSLLLLCGDILCLAQMHGFKCAFRLGRKPFFYCDVNQDGLRRINKGGDCQLRTLEKYDKNCMAIEFANGPEKTKL